MDKRSWLLLTIGELIRPIQIQKTLFIFAQESGAPANQLYQFVPYNWGPCSFEIYDDLTALRKEGFIDAVPSGRGWNVYRLTELGRVKQEALRAKANADHIKALDEAREWVTSRDFETLLRDVYKKYPKYAKDSLFTK